MRDSGSAFMSQYWISGSTNPSSSPAVSFSGFSVLLFLVVLLTLLADALVVIFFVMVGGRPFFFSVMEALVVVEVLVEGGRPLGFAVEIDDASSAVSLH